MTVYANLRDMFRLDDEARLSRADARAALVAWHAHHPAAGAPPSPRRIADALRRFGAVECDMRRASDGAHVNAWRGIRLRREGEPPEPAREVTPPPRCSRCRRDCHYCASRQ